MFTFQPLKKIHVWFCSFIFTSDSIALYEYSTMYSIVDGHLSFSLIWGFWWIYPFLLGTYLRMELLLYRICLNPALVDTTKKICKVITSIYILTAVYKNYCYPYSYQYILVLSLPFQPFWCSGISFWFNLHFPDD